MNMSPTALFCQVARMHSTTANYESHAMPSGINLSVCHQRTSHDLQTTNQLCGCFQRMVSTVSLIRNQRNLGMILHGVKQRDHPRKYTINNFSLPHEISQVTTRRGKPRGQTKKTSTDNTASEDVTNLHAYHGQKNEKEPVPAHQIRQGHLFQYTNIVPELSFQQLKNEFDVSQAVIKLIAEVSRNSIRSHGWFTVALPGGSLVKVLKGLVEEPGIEWPKWHVFWVDERVVPLADDDSNFKLAMGMFLSKTKIPKEQIHPIKYEGSANIVATKYGHLLRSLVKRKVLNLDMSGAFPRFDMILLGIGPDGHVASLFPNSLGLAEEREWVVAVLHSPKPPPKRISMTLPIINAASHVCFAVVGPGKAEIVQRVLEKATLPGALPAQMVRPSNGVLHWFVDKEAAENLSISMWDDPKKFPAQNYSAAKTSQ